MQDMDAAILHAVEEILRKKGFETISCSEDALCTCPEVEGAVGLFAILHMARGRRALLRLAELEQKGVPVLNSAQRLLTINRTRLLQESCQKGISVPSFAICERGGMKLPFWWKRDDEVSQRADDVVLVQTEQEWTMIQQRGIANYVLEEHIEGDLLKFYSVQGTTFFHWNYPTYSKFGKEKENGSVMGYSFDESLLKQQADLLAKTVGLKVFGGDAIVDKNGRIYIIDLNDWPSFASCREEAALAIAENITKQNG